MTKRHLPLIGVLLGLLILVAAATRYPGGTYKSANTVGYDWTQHYLSTLFTRQALNGAPNPSRAIAIPGMLILCISIAVLFRVVSLKSPSKAVAKSIEIGGIGSAVYAFIAVTTRMHDLLVTVGVMFYVVATVATLMMLYTIRQKKLFVAGAVCFASFLTACVIYYGNVFYAGLAVMQKASLLASIGWLLVVYFAEVTPSLEV